MPHKWTKAPKILIVDDVLVKHEASFAFFTAPENIRASQSGNNVLRES
jgi:hypothetical protein